MIVAPLLVVILLAAESSPDVHQNDQTQPQPFERALQLVDVDGKKIVPWEKERYLRGQKAGLGLDIDENGHVYSAALLSSKFGDDALEQLTQFPELRRLVTMQCTYTDKGLSHLAKVKHLVELELFSDSITDDGLRPLANLEQLESLKIVGAGVHGSGLRFLKNCHKLRKLDLSGSEMDNDAAPYLGEIVPLKTLFLNGKISMSQCKNLGNLKALEEFQPGYRIGDHDIGLLVGVKGLRSLGFHDLSDKGLADLEKLQSLQCAEFDESCKLTEQGVARLAGMPKLASVGYTGQSIGDRELRGLRNFRQLTILYVSGLKVTDDGLAALDGLSNLRTLDLARTSIGDKAMKHVALHRRICRLDLSETRITDSGIKALESLPELGALYLRKTAIGDKAMGTILRFKSLTDLDLAGTSLTDEGLEEIVKHPRICNLDVSNTRVTDQSVQFLFAATRGKNLFGVNAFGTSMTGDAVQTARSFKKDDWMSVNTDQ